MLGLIFVIMLFGRAYGQGGDLMIDTMLGEMPNPLVAGLANSGSPITITNGAVAGQGTQPGGGFGSQVSLLSLLGRSSDGLLSMDPSSLTGVASGQNVYLTGYPQDNYLNGLLNTVSVPMSPASALSSSLNDRFALRNEEFTALGDVGHLVRVPISSGTDSAAAGLFGAASQDTGPHSTSMTAAKVTINGNPIEIIGVADMNQLDASGNPQFFSFNPGTGSAAEIAALQNALLGKAVDMNSFIPPPYSSGPSPIDTSMIATDISLQAQFGGSSPSNSHTSKISGTQMTSGSTHSVGAIESAGTSQDVASSLTSGTSQISGSSSLSQGALDGSMSTGMLPQSSVSTVTTIETIETNIINETSSAASSESSAASATSSAASATSSAATSTNADSTQPETPGNNAINQQLDMLLSQGHAQSNSANDISAIMGQIDTAINDINKNSETFSTGTDRGGFGQTAIGRMSTQNTGLNTNNIMNSNFQSSSSSLNSFSNSALDVASLSDSASHTGANSILRLPTMSDTVLRKIGSANVVGGMTTGSVETNRKQGSISVGDRTFGFGTSQTKKAITGANIQVPPPHANDMTVGGMYPFEGNMMARETTVVRGTPVMSGRKSVTKSGNSIKDALHAELINSSLEKYNQSSTTGNGFTFGQSLDRSALKRGGTGIFAISSGPLGTPRLETLNALSQSLPPSLLVTSDTISFSANNSIPQGANVPRLASDKSYAPQLVLSHREPNKEGAIIPLGAVSEDTNKALIDNARNNIMLTAGSGTSSNAFNAFSSNVLAAQTLTTNVHSTGFADAANVPIRGSNGGPITNLEGITGLTGGVTVSRSGTTVPGGSFVIGAGQPNATIISSGRRDSNPNSISLSSRPDSIGTFSIGSISTNNMVSGGMSSMDPSSSISTIVDVASTSSAPSASLTNADNSLGSSQVDVAGGIDVGSVSIPNEIGTHGIDIAKSDVGKGGSVTVTVTTTEEITEVVHSSTANKTNSEASVGSSMGTAVSLDAGLLDRSVVDPSPPVDPTALLQSDTGTIVMDTNVPMNSLDTKMVVDGPAITNGGIAIGGQVPGTGDMSIFNKISLPESALRPRFRNEILGNQITTKVQGPVDMTSFVPPSAEQPRASPLIMAPPDSQRFAEVTKVIVDTTTQRNPIVVPFTAGSRSTNSGLSSTKSGTTSFNERSATGTIGSGISVFPNINSPGLPAKVDDRTKVIDLTRTLPRSPGTPAEWRQLSNQNGRRNPITGVTVGQGKPIVGSVFQNTANSGSPVLTQKFLENNGMTQKPAFDFMTTFLNQMNKPSDSVSLSQQQNHLRIVPLLNRKTRPTTINMFNAARKTSKSEPNPGVNRFGVADIKTRKQHLDRNQWMNFISSRSPDSASQAKYQTQNVLSASETRPLNGNSPTGILIGGHKKSTSSRQNRTRSHSGLSVFEAPGMSGHSAVSVSSFQPQNTNIHSSKMSSSTKSNAFVDRPSQDTMVQVTENQTGRVGNQATAIKTSEFANNFKRTLTSKPASGTVMSKPNLPTLTLNAVDTNLDTSGSSVSINTGISPSLDRSGTSFTVNEATTLTERQSPSNGVLRNLQGPISTTNIERMQVGEPVFLNTISGSNVGAVSTGTQQAGNGLVVKAINNVGTSATTKQHGFITPVSNVPLVDNTQAQIDKNANATPFTSGNRFAVFGRTNDMGGRTFSSKKVNQVTNGMRVGVLGPRAECRYQPDPQSRYHFIFKNGLIEHRLRCALGTAFDELTCECSIRLTDHGLFTADDCLEVHMDFNNGVVEDSSLNRLPIGNQNVQITNSSSPLSGIALFGGDGKLTIWRYQNYDFRNHVMLKIQFRPGPGGDRFQSLISNCGPEGPSIAIIYDSKLKEVLLFLKTYNETTKELSFRINPDEWNDVTYIYDGQEFIGIVNGVRRYVSRQDPHLLGIIGGEIKSTPNSGLIEIRDAALELGQCEQYGNFIGAMVDIQVYTCIPRDFRLE